MELSDLHRAVGKIEGTIAEKNKAIDEKLDTILKELKAQQKKCSSVSDPIIKRVTTLENFKKSAVKITVLTGAFISFVVTSVVNYFIRVST